MPLLSSTPDLAALWIRSNLAIEVLSETEIAEALETFVALELSNKSFELALSVKVRLSIFTL